MFKVPLKSKYLIGLSLIVVVSATVLLKKIWPVPPLNDMKLAHEALSEIKKVHSDIYCPKTYKNALLNYDKAMKYWRNQNEKFAFSRSFDSVSYYARQTVKFCKKAKSKSIARATGLRWYIRNQIDSINNQKEFFQDIFFKMPLPVNIQRQNSKGFLLLNEAEIAYNNQKYTISEEKLEAAKENIATSYDFAFNKLNDYFMKTKTWQEMARNTIEKTKKQKTTAIIVDKFSRECMVYSSGKLKYKFNIELGPNWMSEKQVKGDKATPEGIYKIVSKIKHPNTKYYKALLIDYPNDKDKSNFEKAKRRKILPVNAEIGGLIEIHGHGNKGADWTNGCVALKNEDMDIVFRELTVGTVVTIVGSLKPINEILIMPGENENILN